jgi:hypothetical protein
MSALATKRHSTDLFDHFVPAMAPWNPAEIPQCFLARGRVRVRARGRPIGVSLVGARVKSPALLVHSRSWEILGGGFASNPF